MTTAQTLLNAGLIAIAAFLIGYFVAFCPLPRRRP